MRFFKTSAFARLFRKLPPDRKDSVERAMLLFGRILEESRPVPGLGLKELRPGIWELRAGLLDRIIFSRSGDEVEFLIVGSHDEIRRFLRRL